MCGTFLSTNLHQYCARSKSGFEPRSTTVYANEFDNVATSKICHLSEIFTADQETAFGPFAGII